jgi:hypothetical protein
VRLQLPILLPTRLGEIVWIVFGADNDLEGRRRGDERGDVEAEGGVTPFVRPRLDAVDPHRRAVVDGSEPEAEAVPRRGRLELDRAAVPAVLVKAGVANTAGRCLRRKRHDDNLAPLNLRKMGPCTGAIERELPLAVQRIPLMSFELWTRIAPSARVERIGTECL